MNKIVSLFCGIIFGIGLVISEMINPAKVLGFLNIFDKWDPSLAFVMIGALIVSTPLFHLFKKNDKPLFSSSFSILFGTGWGLVGLCPGPAISSLALLNISSVAFVFWMSIGFYIASKFNK